MKNFIFALLLLFSNLLLAQEKNNLEFKESIYSVKIELENGKNYLELGKENKIQIILKNIDPVNMSCVGRGLKRGNLSDDTNNTNWTAMVDNVGLKDGKYSLTIAFRGRSGKRYNHTFLIEVK